MKASSDTIVAPASGQGRAGVGVIRLSGNKVRAIAEALLGSVPEPRFARRSRFFDADNQVIDDGLALFFAGPKSFTGEDVLELQGHGGPVVMDMLIRRCVSLGAHLARPGEFSERAFLNDKLDLAQAEAIADLIDARSEQAVRLAARSLQGEFSARVHQLVEGLTHLRIYVEAAIDFPEEEIDFLADGKILSDLQSLQAELDELLRSAKQGAVMREGIQVVIAGKPNAGKSSLLNALAGRETAIVTDIPGTTRDILREQIIVDGLPVQLTDTAGLRLTEDKVEQIGIARAEAAIKTADAVLLVVDSSEAHSLHPDELWPLPTPLPLSPDKILVNRNKCDLSGLPPSRTMQGDAVLLNVSAATGAGLPLLVQELKRLAHLEDSEEGLFLARRRHLDALEQAQVQLAHGAKQLIEFRAGELLAEELRQAQQTLSTITGAFTADDLLGRIFSSFCIGK